MCLEYVKKKVPGKNRFEYAVKHVKSKHVAELVKKERDRVHGLGEGGLGSEIVRVGDFVHYLSPSETFKPYLDFEVHGMKWITGRDIIACDPTLFAHKEIKWTYCDFVININEGRILVFVTPNKKFPKYGLNKDRYYEFIIERDKQLSKIVGYDVHYFLEIIQFDLHQDDYLFEFRGKWLGRHIVAGMVNEYKLTIQRYGVQRKEHPVSPSDRIIKRFECRFKSKKTIQDLARIIPDVLSLEVDSVQAIANLEGWGEFMKSRALGLEKIFVNVIPSLFSVIHDIQNLKMNSDNMDNYASKLTEIMNEIVQVENQIQEENIVSRVKNDIDTLSEQVSEFQQFTLERFDQYDSLVEVMEDIQIAYKQHNMSFRKIAKQLNKSHEWVRQKFIDIEGDIQIESREQGEWRKSISQVMVSQSEILKKNDGEIEDLISIGESNRDLIEEVHADLHVSIGSLVMMQQSPKFERARYIQLDANFKELLLKTISSSPGMNNKKLRGILQVNNQKLTDHIKLLQQEKSIQSKKNGRGFSWHVKGNGKSRRTIN